MKIRTYYIKIKEGTASWRVMEDFQASCWYEGQQVFTRKIRKMIEGKYVRFDTSEEAEMFCIDFKGPGHYPIKEGDILLDEKLYDTFSTGNTTFTIRVVKS